MKKLLLSLLFGFFLTFFFLLKPQPSFADFPVCSESPKIPIGITQKSDTNYVLNIDWSKSDIYNTWKSQAPNLTLIVMDDQGNTIDWTGGPGNGFIDSGNNRKPVSTNYTVSIAPDRISTAKSLTFKLLLSVSDVCYIEAQPVTETLHPATSPTPTPPDGFSGTVSAGSGCDPARQDTSGPNKSTPGEVCLPGLVCANRGNGFQCLAKNDSGQNEGASCNPTGDDNTCARFHETCLADASGVGHCVAGTICPVCPAGFVYSDGKCAIGNGIPSDSPPPSPESILCNGQQCITGVGCDTSDVPFITPDPSSFNPCNDSTDCMSVQTALGFAIPTSAAGFAASVLGLLLAIGGIILVIIIIITGYRLMFSQGDPEKVKAAREQLTGAVAGLIFMIFSIAILSFIGINILHIPQFIK